MKYAAALSLLGCLAWAVPASAQEIIVSEPTVTYYAPSVPVTTYYAPATTYYAPSVPVATYYAPSVPVTSYYAPAAAYYYPAPYYYASPRAARRFYRNAYRW